MTSIHDALLKLELSKDLIKTDPETCLHFGRDWTTYYDIRASAVVFPQSTIDVQKIVKWARLNKISLVPSGGRTGLSGAACALNGEVIVSFDKMNTILSYNPTDSTVHIQAGVITEELQNFAIAKERLYPVDFAARGSSQMGGNIATNAGGIKVVRYGLTRDWVAGLTVVTGAGEILQLNNGLVKNATGLDFRHLFIGSEGILGFITEALIKLAPKPPPKKVILLALSSMKFVMDVFAEFKNKTSLVAYEMFSEKAMQKVIDNTGLPRPLETVTDFYVVAEVDSPTGDAENSIMNVFENALEKGWVVDGVISQSDSQEKQFWRYREDISESLAKYSPYKNDIAVPISFVPLFMKDLDTLLSEKYPTWEVVWFGHIGDGNLHINILRPSGMTKEVFVQECRKVDEFVFQIVQKNHGSISAEHGVGLSKKSFLHYTRSHAEIDMMRSIKRVFDPDGIINPGKVV